MAPKLAYVGLGNMGAAMAKNLVEKGNLTPPLLLWNRTVSKAEAAAARIGHCEIVSSIEDAVSKSDIIFSCVADDTAAAEIFEKALSVDVKGKSFVSCSTITPQTTETLSRQVEAKGAGFVSMTVFGEPGLAEKGLLVCVPVGQPEEVKKVLPFTTGVIGRAVIDLSGEPLYKGTLLKMIGNIFIIAMMETVAEGHVMAEKTGLGHEPLQKMIQAIFPSPCMIYSDRMVTGRYYSETPIVDIHMARKLGGEVLELAKEHGAQIKAYEVGQAHLEMVKSYEGKNKDVTGLFGAVRVESGLPFEIKNQHSGH